MSNIYLYNYNNYFNKIYKKEDTLEEYGTPIYTLLDTNFNYNDGVDTSHVVNYDEQDGDYLIVTDKNNEIVSRWFVTENVRNRGGQHTLTLRRDLRVDLRDLYMNIPMLIHRGMVNDINNPLLFNSEGFSFNQIKKSEHLLKDTCEVPWYVLYFNDPKAHEIRVQSADLVPDVVISQTMSSLIGSYSYVEQCEGLILFQTDDAVANNYKFHIATNYPYIGYLGVYSADVIWFDASLNTINSRLTPAFTNKYDQIKNVILQTESIPDQLSSSQYASLINLNNKLVKDSNNNFYNVTVTVENRNVPEKYYDEDYDNDFTLYCKGIINSTGLERTGDWGDSFGVRINRKMVTVTATPYQDNDTIVISNLFESSTPARNPKVETMDSDYRVIAIPADDFKMYSNQSTYSTASKSLLKKAISAIMLAYPRDELIDVQYLPYCPLQKELVKEGIYGYNLSVNEYEEFASTGGTVYKFPVLYIENANISFNIDFEIKIPNLDYPALEARPIDYKIKSDTSFIRLVSPNYNGQFEFNYAKNLGIDYFNVDMTLKPINPYIHINPNFKNLYGDDYNDARGLICQGDFSLPIHSDQFVEYEYRNKNYANTFERQIEKLDFEQGQERIKTGFGLGAGALVGGIGGAVTGGKIGGGIGAAVGGAIGGVGSLVGGIIDYNMMTARQAQEKDFIIDNYKFQLGNVKALANSISKVTPLSYNNKIFPFIELYECSDEEIKIFKNYLKYKSMTIEAIDYLNNYIIPDERTFVAATMFICEDANIPTHELEELRLELEKGAYM